MMDKVFKLRSKQNPNMYSIGGYPFIFSSKGKIYKSEKTMMEFIRRASKKFKTDLLQEVDIVRYRLKEF